MVALHELHGVVYTRKSTVSDGKSTRDQERENRHWCETNKIRIEKVFCDEGISASRYSRKTRDAWAELKAYLRPGHILVACEASRAARDIEEFAALRNLCAQHKVPFAYNGRVLDLTSGDDRFVGGLDALLAERESEQIRDRTLRGKRGAALMGTPGGRAPWGYRAIPRVPGQRPQWEIDPVEGPRLREAIARIIDGESMRSVLKWLRSTGYAPATITALRDCVINPTLAGKRVYQGKVVGQATWPPLITEGQHAKITVAARRGTFMPSGPEPKWLCSGVVTCGKCGARMQHRLNQHAKRTYECPDGHVTRIAEVLERGVERAVLRRLANINPNDYSSDNPKITEASRRIDELDADLAKWRAKALAEEVDAEMYAQIEKDRKRKIAELRPCTIVASKALLTHATWHDGTMREKRETIRALLNISVPSIKHLGRRATEDDVDITPKS